MYKMVMGDVKKRFLAGFCQAGTPISHKFERNINPLKCRADELINGADFFEDNFVESFSYLGGCVFGLRCILYRRRKIFFFIL